MKFSITRNEIRDAALALRGVKFRHQGRDPKTGIDCVGLLVAVGEAIKYPEIFDLEGYRRTPSASVIRDMMTQNCDEIDLKDAGVGDVYLMRMFGIKPRHTSIIVNTDTDYAKGIVPSIVHAAVNGVMVAPISSFPASWFVAAFRIRGLVD